MDHVATVRQARLIDMPDPVEAALLAEAAGADGITVHLREDRRHIQDRDVAALRERLKTRLNLEMAATAEMTQRALEFKPDQVCIVPERREELTTEGGLDVAAYRNQIRDATKSLEGAGILVSLFVDPDERQIKASREVGASGIEIHTGAYCDAGGGAASAELEAIRGAARCAESMGLEVHAGHGLNLENVQPVAVIDEIVELNIGHSIVARAIMVGMARAVAEMKRCIAAVRKD